MEMFSNHDIETPYMLVFFGFTNCHMVCPTGMYNISEALDSLDINLLNKSYTSFYNGRSRARYSRSHKRVFDIF